MGLLDKLKRKSKDELQPMQKDEQYLAEFREGNFLNKKAFVESILKCNDRKMFLEGLRQFIAVCSHEDFALLSDFFASQDTERLQAFLGCVKVSLSLQSVPYLLALLERWEKTDIGMDIQCIILEMLGKNCNEDYVDIDKCGQTFVEFAKDHNLSKYYYRGEYINYGNMTKELITVAISCRAKKQPFYAGILPEILANMTGVPFPVFGGEDITDDKVSQVFGFVKQVAERNPQVGEKYYYGYKI